MKKGDIVTYEGRYYYYVTEINSYYIFGDEYFPSKMIHAIRKDLIDDRANKKRKRSTGKSQKSET